MLSERLQNRRLAAGSGGAHSSSAHIGWSSVSRGGGGGKVAVLAPRGRGGQARGIKLEEVVLVLRSVTACLRALHDGQAKAGS